MIALFIVTSLKFYIFLILKLIYIKIESDRHWQKLSPSLAILSAVRKWTFLELV